MPITQLRDDCYAHSFLGQPLRNVLREGARRSHETGSVDADSLAIVRESGLLAMSVSKEYGGSDLSISQTNSVIEDIATLNPSLAIMLYLHCAVAARIQAYGTDTQKRRYLSAIVDNAWLAASAWSEPGGTADKQRLATTLIPDARGHLYLNGRKAFCTSAVVADFFIVLVELASNSSSKSIERTTYGGSNQAIVLVDSKSPGVNVKKETHDIVGMRGSGTGMVEFIDVRVSKANILCEGSSCSEAIQLPHQLGLTLAAVSLGIARSAYQLTIDELSEHVSGRDGDLRQKLALVAISIESAEAVISNLTAGSEKDRSRRALGAKVFVSTGSQLACSELRTLIGSAAYLTEHEIQRISRDSEAVIHMGPPNHLCMDLIANSLQRFDFGQIKTEIERPGPKR